MNRFSGNAAEPLRGCLLNTKKDAPRPVTFGYLPKRRYGEKIVMLMHTMRSRATGGRAGVAAILVGISVWNVVDGTRRTPRTLDTWSPRRRSPSEALTAMVIVDMPVLTYHRDLERAFSNWASVQESCAAA